MPDAVVMTDPARELAELCEALRGGLSASNIRGEQHLAEKFDVDPWSLAFFEIIFTIMQRVHEVGEIIFDLDMDDDFKSEIQGHVSEIGEAFTAENMRGQWASGGAIHLGRENVQPLKGVAGLVRRSVSFRKLPDEEVEELKTMVVDLREWLEERQLSDNDFIRQALIEGLNRMHFRLVRLRWVGWGYTLGSLREVIAAYVMLERTGVSADNNPDAEAVLRRVNGLIKSVYEKVSMAKGATETADWLIRAYGVGTLLYQGTSPVRALLGHAG